MSVNASVSATSTTATAAIPVNCHGSGNGPVALVLDFTTGTGVGTADVQFTFDEPSDSAAVWLPLSSTAGKTATFTVGEIMPMRAVRLKLSAYTSGTVTLRVFQGIA